MSSASSTQISDSPAVLSPVSNRRRFPWRIARHFLGEYLLPLVGAVLAFTMVTLLLSVFDTLPDFADKGVPVWSIIKFFIASTPVKLVVVLPFSSLLAISFMTMVLDKNNELTAVRAAGISLLKAGLPIILTSFILGGIVVALNERLIPLANDFVADIQERYLNKKKDGKKKTEEHLAYFNRKELRHWFFTTLADNGNTATGVVIRQMDDQNRTVYVLSCDDAVYKPDKKAWVLGRGGRMDYDYQDGVPVPRVPVPFEAMETSFSEPPRDIRLQSMDYEHLPMSILNKLKNSPEMLDHKIRRMIQSLCIWRIFSPFAAVIATLLGYSMTMAGARRSAARGFVIAVALFMSYVLLAQFALFLGKNGYLPPVIAGSVPTIIALLFSGILIWKKQ